LNTAWLSIEFNLINLKNVFSWIEDEKNHFKCNIRPLWHLKFFSGAPLALPMDEIEKCNLSQTI
jgi:hypothetical protein